MTLPPSPYPWPSFEETCGQRKALYKRLGLASLAAIGLHLLLGLALPKILYLRPKAPLASSLVELELEHFLEPNPAAPTHEPDKTSAVAYKSQQAAQEKPIENALGPLPTLDGEWEDSQSIVEASQETLTPSVEWVEPRLETNPSFAQLPYVQEANLAAEEEDSVVQTLSPLVGEGIKVESVSPEALERASNEPIRISVPMEERAEPSTGASRVSDYVPPQRPVPQPRPRLSAKALQAPIKKAQTHVKSIGLIAIDAKWSIFGAYQQQVLEAISLQWQLLASHLKSIENDKRSEVVVEFNLNPDGRVEALKVLKTTASRPATLVCQDAIQSREPFGVWPEEMVKRFGKEKRVCIHFFYR